LNQPAIDIYKDNGIDITKEYLEIAVCAQHNNGGLKGNLWRESNIKHLFPVGEVNGTHGVHRPCGTALNSGQVGSLRAALYISERYSENPMDDAQFFNAAAEQIKRKFEFSMKIIDSQGAEVDFLKTTRKEIQEKMSACGAHIRKYTAVKQAIPEAWSLYSKLKEKMKIASAKDV